MLADYVSRGAETEEAVFWSLLNTAVKIIVSNNGAVMAVITLCNTDISCF